MDRHTITRELIYYPSIHKFQFDRRSVRLWAYWLPLAAGLIITAPTRQFISFESAAITLSRAGTLILLPN